MSIHQRKLQLVPTDAFLVKNGIAPELMNDIFQFVKKPFNLRDTSILHRKRTKKCIDSFFISYKNLESFT